MPRTAENPKKHIVSARISDDEKTIMSQLAQEKGINLSDLLRQGIDFLCSDRISAPGNC